jgi:hypothetical protein
VATATDELRLVDPGHEYWLGNRRLLGATEALTSVGLIDPRWFTEEACLRGTYIHDAIEMDLQNDLGECDPLLLPYVEAARKFLRDGDAEVLLVEAPLPDPLLGIAGKLDLLCRWQGKTAVVDWKSGSKAKWHAYQTAIYKHLVTVNKKCAGAIERCAVYLRDDGTYSIEPHTGRNDWAIAQAAITVAQVKRTT